jgi:hypothetical protein
MKMSDAFPSQWLNASDLEEGDITVTIDDETPVQWHEFKSAGKPTPENKPALYFKAPKGTKPLILNKTNWKAIGKVLESDDSDDWGGQQITLYATEVESFGEMAMGIRVRLKKPGKKVASAGQSKPAAAPALAKAEEADDEIPF